MKAGYIGAGLAALLAACGGAPQGTSAVATVVDTAGGVVRVGNAGTPPTWRAERVLRLGSLEGGPEEFGRIRSLLADADGNVYVADEIAQEIRVFAPDGRHVRSIGRKGAGPGEFGDLYGLAWLEGGKLAAMDPRNARIGILSREGEWLEAIQHFPIFGPMIRLHPLGDAGFYAPIMDARQDLALARFTADGPRDTIPMPLRPAGQTPAGLPRTTAICRQPNGGLHVVTLPEVPMVEYAFPPPGGTIAVSWTGEYRIAFLTPAGDTLRVVTRERPPLPYTDALYEEGMRPYRELRETHPGLRCEPGEPERPSHRAALRHFLFDEAGRMWVEAAAEDGFVWEVFDAEGRLLGAFSAPPRAADVPPYVRDGRLYQVETDDADVQYVVVYRIEGLQT